MRCSKCGVENRRAARFCEGCGSALEAVGPQCISCRAVNRLGVKYCDGCGASLNASAPYLPSNTAARTFSTDIPRSDAHDGELRTLPSLSSSIRHNGSRLSPFLIGASLL